MPAALVEIGFVTSPIDRALMARDDYREQVAAAIVAACIRFVRGERPQA
jgi:N-acetylmuramoyl-L-alanine amidase